MSIRVKCGSCQQTIKAEDRYAGRTVRCPGCREPITIPNLAAPVTSPTPDEALDPFAAASAPAPPPPPVVKPASKSRKPRPAAKPAEPQAREVPEEEIGDWLSDGPPLRSESFEPDPEPAPQSPNWSGVTETYDLAETPRDDSDGTGNLPPVIPKKKKKKRPKDSDEIRMRSPYDSDARPVGRPWLLWALAVCMLPLVISVFLPGKSLPERIELAAAEDPALADRLEALPELSDDPVGTLLSAFPDNRIPGAAFRHDTFWHYGLAAVSAIGFLGLILAAWPDEEVSPGYLIGMGLLTGTVGIFLLLSFQWLADATQGFYLRGRSIIIVLFYVVRFIGFSYRCAIDPSIDFGLSFTGFTFGVGLCEELCKAVPIVLYLWGNHKHTWQGATVVGFASGIGFGVSEGIMYSAEMYNG
ncbi:MAG TPA: PrsW family glutamic-type intramembrane protease, partial [Caulifigura sp.]|nr:PrsW family glutamic-type intramembrane protease [Caulifigura sp.]